MANQTKIIITVKTDITAEEIKSDIVTVLTELHYVDKNGRDQMNIASACSTLQAIFESSFHAVDA